MAAALSLGQRLLTLDETIDAWLAGARFMMTGLVLLILAWAIADVADALQTAPYLITVLGETLSPYALPAIVFLLAGATAFASGSSWGKNTTGTTECPSKKDCQHFWLFWKITGCPRQWPPRPGEIMPT